MSAIPTINNPAPIYWDTVPNPQHRSWSKVRSAAASCFASLATLSLGAAYYLSLKAVVAITNIHLLLAGAALFTVVAFAMKMWPHSLEDPAYRLQLQKKIEAEVRKGTSYSELTKQFPMDKLFSREELSSIFQNRMPTYASYPNFVNKEGTQAEALLCENNKKVLFARTIQGLTTVDTIIDFINNTTYPALAKEAFKQLSHNEMLREDIHPIGKRLFGDAFSNALNSYNGQVSRTCQSDTINQDYREKFKVFYAKGFRQKVLELQ